jgi:hypothetical protein
MFTAGLYDSPYPFSGSTRPRISEERFKLGEQMLFEMQCLQCHAMGGEPLTHDKPAKPGQTAPNLVLARDRLQRRWTRHWVQEPYIIQIGTAMPPFFTGLPVYSLDGQSWPEAQKTGRPKEEVEADYGKTPEAQANLLLDFLYEAGARNYQTEAPPAGAGPKPKPLPVGPPPTQSEPDSAGDPTQGTDPSKAPVEKVPTEKPARPGDDEEMPAKEPAATETTTEKPPKAEPTEPTEEEKPAPKPGAAGNVAVAGKVMFDGEPPERDDINMSAVPQCAEQHANPVPDETIVVNEDGTLANVVVYVSEGLPAGQEFPVPQEPAVLDQVGCQYVPHVLPMMVGQEIRVKNSDPFLHNVHSFAVANEAFNKGQPNIDPGMPVGPMRVPETFTVKCDVHPWMQCQFVVLEHPFFAVTGDDGAFSLAGLPPGEYTLTAWHEKLGTRQAQVTVEEGQAAEATFTFAAAGADAGTPTGAPGIPVRLASAVLKPAGAAAANRGRSACEHCVADDATAASSR